MAIHDPTSSPSSISQQSRGPRRLIPIFATGVMVFLTAGLSYAFFQQQGVIQEQRAALNVANGKVASLSGELAGYRQVAVKVQHLDDMFSSFQENGKAVSFTDFVAGQQARVKDLEKTVDEITARKDNEKIAGLNTKVASLETMSSTAEQKLSVLEPKVAEAETRVKEVQDQLPALVRTQVESTVADARTQLDGRLDQQREKLNSLEQRVSGVEGQVALRATKEEVNSGLKTKASLDDLKAKASRDELDNRYDQLEKRIHELEQRALSMVVLREGQEGLIPGVGLNVRLNRIDKSGAIAVVVSAQGSEPLPLTVQLGQAMKFDYAGGHYKITVGRIVKVPTRAADFLQVFIEAV